jgi:hypothetical protein
VHFEILEVEVFNSKFPHIKNMKREGGLIVFSAIRFMRISIMKRKEKVFSIKNIVNI